MPKKRFLRRTWSRYSKLGKGRKKLQKWRKPTGRHNKMREKRGSYPDVVSIGYKKNKLVRGKIENKNPVMIKNILEIENLEKNSIVIIGKIGRKKKIEIVKKLNEKKIPVKNLDVKKFLEEINKSPEKKK